MDKVIKLDALRILSARLAILVSEPDRVRVCESWQRDVQRVIHDIAAMDAGDPTVNRLYEASQAMADYRDEIYPLGAGPF